MRRSRVHLPRLFRTASFVLAASYAALFALSAMILGAVSLLTIHDALDRQTTDRIASEVATLETSWQEGGLARLLATVHAREHAPMALDYGVEDAAGNRLAGVLPPLKGKPAWFTLNAGPRRADSLEEPRERLRVNLAVLADGTRVAVGADLSRIDDVEETVLTAFGWVTVLVPGLGIIGGILLSLGFLRRLDAITRTAEAIIAGDLHRRIPLRGSGDDLDRLAGTLNAMLDRIGALMESLRQVSNDIAHDLRTPLSRLCQGLNAARAKAGSAEEFEAAIDHAIAEAEAILQTFGALLRIAQIEAGSRRAGFREVDLRELAASVAEVFEPVAEDQRHRLQTELAEVPRVQGDRELLVQMLVNLVENGLRHTPEGCTVRVALAPVPGGAELSVADDGPGVPETERGRILGRFYRRETSRTTPGSGLGLSLVAAVADLHQAQLAIEDAAPGLRVRIRFRAGGQNGCGRPGR